MEFRFPVQWKPGTAIAETNSLYLIFKEIQDRQGVTDGKGTQLPEQLCCTEVHKGSDIISSACTAA